MPDFGNLFSGNTSPKKNQPTNIPKDSIGIPDKIDRDEIDLDLKDPESMLFLIDKFVEAKCILQVAGCRREHLPFVAAFLENMIPGWAYAATKMKEATLSAVSQKSEKIPAIKEDLEVILGLINAREELLGVKVPESELVRNLLIKLAKNEE